MIKFKTVLQPAHDVNRSIIKSARGSFVRLISFVPKDKETAGGLKWGRVVLGGGQCLQNSGRCGGNLVGCVNFILSGEIHLSKALCPKFA